MNQLINDIFNLWGIEASTPLITTIIIFTSLLLMATILLVISKIAKPSASNNRSFIFKSFVIFCMIACLLTLNVTIGGNIIFKEKEGETPSTPTTPILKDGYVVVSIQSVIEFGGELMSVEQTHTIDADGILYAGDHITVGPDGDLLNGSYLPITEGSVIFVKTGDVYECYTGGVYYLALPTVDIADAIE